MLTQTSKRSGSLVQRAVLGEVGRIAKISKAERAKVKGRERE
jgi:hypothetical protein